MRQIAVGVVFLLVWSLCGCGEESIAQVSYTGSKVPGATDTGNFSGVDPASQVPTTPFAANITISEVAAYQTVKVTLMKDGQTVSNRQAPIVGEKDAFLRVFVEPQPGWASREIIATLSLESSSQTHPSQSVKKFVTSASSDRGIDSTFNFNIDGSLLEGDLQYSVTLFEATTGDVTGDTSGALWPSGGKAMFNADTSNHTLEIVLVPIRYNSDGSGRLPDVSAAQVERYRAALSAMYPAATVDIRVRETLDWQDQISAFGQGWGQLLSGLQGLRSQDGASSREYYYGVFSPASSYQNFCRQGCVGGLSSLAQDYRYSQARTSIGLGFSGDATAATLVHEVGHAHGREHAPCGLMGQASDRNFPNDTAKLEEWGFDARDQSLMAPSATYVDMMSYCNPIWVSAYTYNALADRIVAVNSLASFQEPKDGDTSNSEWLVLVAEPDGSWNFGTPVVLNEYPYGIEREVALKDGNGKTIEIANGEYFPYSHGENGLVMVRRPNANVKFLEFDGSVLKL